MPRLRKPKTWFFELILQLWLKIAIIDVYDKVKRLPCQTLYPQIIDK